MKATATVHDGTTHEMVPILDKEGRDTGVKERKCAEGGGCESANVYWQSKSDEEIFIEYAKKNPEGVKRTLYLRWKPFFIRKKGAEGSVCDTCQTLTLYREVGAKTSKELHILCGTPRGCQSCADCRDGSCKKKVIEAWLSPNKFMASTFCAKDKDNVHHLRCIKFACADCPHTKNGGMPSMFGCPLEQNVTTPVVVHTIEMHAPTVAATPAAGGGGGEGGGEGGGPDEGGDSDGGEGGEGRGEGGREEEEGGGGGPPPATLSGATSAQLAQEKRRRKTTKKVPTLVTKTMTRPDFYKMVMKHVNDKVVVHAHHVANQRIAYQNFLLHLPPHVLAALMDFGMNFPHVPLLAIASMHWANQQTTVYPVVIYRMIRKAGGGLMGEDVWVLVQERIVFISADTNHDNLFVQHCIKSLLSTSPSSLPTSSSTCASPLTTALPSSSALATSSSWLPRGIGRRVCLSLINGQRLGMGRRLAMPRPPTRSSTLCV
jgi:hypothetical protein